MIIKRKWSNVCPFTFRVVLLKCDPAYLKVWRRDCLPYGYQPQVCVVVIISWCCPILLDSYFYILGSKCIKIPGDECVCGVYHNRHIGTAALKNRTVDEVKSTEIMIHTKCSS